MTTYISIKYQKFEIMEIRPDDLLLIRCSKYLPKYNFDGVTENMMCSKQLIALVKCSICLMIMDHPVTLQCGHSFCKRCIFQCNRCPICKKYFSRKHPPTKNITLADIIDMQEVMCPANLHDSTLPCKTPVTFRTVQFHIKGCGFILLKCKCGISMPRSSFLMRDSKCLCALVACKFCSQHFSERILSIPIFVGIRKYYVVPVELSILEKTRRNI